MVRDCTKMGDSADRSLLRPHLACLTAFPFTLNFANAEDLIFIG